MMPFTKTITIEFPALDAFVALGNRWLDAQDGQLQKDIDAATTEIKRLTSELQNAIGAK
jgi:hypothetical protein